MKHQKFLFWLACSSLVLISSCVKNPVTQEREAAFISGETEKKIGDKVREQVIEEFGLLKDETLRSYIMAVGQRIVEVSDRKDVEYDFQILDTDMVNAMALPGGYIFVTRGMLEELSDEAELASVLGHEVGHVAARHSVNMIQKSMGFSFVKALGAVGVAIATGDPRAFLFVDQAAGAFGNLFFLGYSRDNELEADAVGLRYVVRSGYDPEGVVTFFERLRQIEEEPETKWDVFFRSHPPTKDRIVLAKSLIEKLPPSHSVGEEGYDRYQEAIDRLERVDPRMAGRTEKGRYVNDAYQFTLELPEGWTFSRMRRQALISVVSPGGKAFGEIRQHALSPWGSTSDYVHEIVKEFKFQMVSGRPVLYPSGYGFLGKSYGLLRGQVMEIRFLAVTRGENGYVMILGAPEDQYESYLVDFERIMRAWKFS